MDEQRGRVRVEDGRKRVRAYLAGHLVLDTIRPVYVWEKPWYPTYYVPRDDVRAELAATGSTQRSPSRGEARGATVRVGGAEAVDAAWSFPDSPVERLRHLVRVDWDAMDAWFEEDERVHTHPRDPYTRVDVLPSSRHVRVEVDGVTVAESVRPTILFETGLPPRTYLPATDVRMDLLRPSDTVSHCPYKGTARYWSVVTDGEVRDDLAWGYDFPLPESLRVAGLVCFYDERVDLVVDGVRQERPRTKFA
jgi:uncharacterized protein (DUF427 family)